MPKEHQKILETTVVIIIILSEFLMTYPKP